MATEEPPKPETAETAAEEAEALGAGDEFARSPGESVTAGKRLVPPPKPRFPETEMGTGPAPRAPMIVIGGTPSPPQASGAAQAWTRPSEPPPAVRSSPPATGNKRPSQPAVDLRSKLGIQRAPDARPSPSRPVQEAPPPVAPKEATRSPVPPPRSEPRAAAVPPVAPIGAAGPPLPPTPSSVPAATPPSPSGPQHVGPLPSFSLPEDSLREAPLPSFALPVEAPVKAPPPTSERPQEKPLPSFSLTDDAPVAPPQPLDDAPTPQPVAEKLPAFALDANLAEPTKERPGALEAALKEAFPAGHAEMLPPPKLEATITKAEVPKAPAESDTLDIPVEVAEPTPAPLAHVVSDLHDLPPNVVNAGTAPGLSPRPKSEPARLRGGPPRARASSPGFTARTPVTPPPQGQAEGLQVPGPPRVPKFPLSAGATQPEPARRSDPVVPPSAIAVMKIVAVGDPTHEVTELEDDAIEQDESERAAEARAAKRARPHAPVEELEELTDDDVAPIPAAAKPAPARAEPAREVPISAAQAEALVAAAPPLPTSTAAPSTGAATAAAATATAVSAPATAVSPPASGASATATNAATTTTAAGAPASGASATAPSLPTTPATPASAAAASGAAASIPSAPREGDAPKPPPPPVRNKPKTPSLPRPAPQTKRRQRPPWWEELFNEDFERANLRLSNEQIRREVDFIEESLGVASGGVVLDLACGNGSHAVELASRGYGVVGYDLSLHQLALASDFANERGQKLNFLQGDMREMAFEEMFDGIFSWNTSFGYFEEEKNAHVAERVFQALRPGGMFLIDVINRDYAAATSPSSLWFEGDSCVCMDDMSVDFITSRLRVKRSVILDDGRTRETVYSIRLYSLHELGKLLHDVGFRVTEASGHPATPGVFFGQHSPRIIMLAQKP